MLSQQNKHATLTNDANVFDLVTIRLVDRHVGDALPVTAAVEHIKNSPSAW